MQGVLVNAGEAVGGEPTASVLAPDDVLGQAPRHELVSLVEGFQKENGLKADGIVGKASIRLLVGGDTTAARIHKLEVAMEQARWLPADLGSRYVFINQNGAARRVPVTVKQIDAESVEIVAGLSDGSRVLVGPNLPLISEGTPVKVETVAADGTTGPTTAKTP